MREPDSGMKGALILWQSWGLNEMADKGQTDAIRKRWNGGTHGLDKVRKAVARGKRIGMGGPQSPSTPKPVTEKDSILKLGSKGPFVTDLQTNLLALGYSVTVDGDFGNGTGTAVKAFQTSAGLKSDGWAGPRTIEAIGQALGTQKAKPKIEKAQEETKDKATQEVEKKTGIWQWVTGIFSSGALGLGWLGGMDWQAIAAIGGVVVVFLIVLLVMRRQIIGAVKDIKGAVESGA